MRSLGRSRSVSRRPRLGVSIGDECWLTDGITNVRVLNEINPTTYRCKVLESDPTKYRKNQVLNVRLENLRR